MTAKLNFTTSDSSATVVCSIVTDAGFFLDDSQVTVSPRGFLVLHTIVPGLQDYLGSPGGVGVNCSASTPGGLPVTVNYVFLLAVPFTNLFNTQ